VDTKGNNNQSNELDTQPKVSNDPAMRLPETTRGQIHNIVSNDPKIDLLRQVRHKEVMRGNTFHLKTGKYSKQLPQYLIDYLSFIDDLSFDNPKVSRDMVTRLVWANLKRIALAEYREQAENSTLDPQLTKLIRDTYVMTMGLHQTPSLLQENKANELDLRGLTNEQLEAIDQLVVSLGALCEPDDPLDLLPS
jgi:hypothetical protein